MGCTNSKTNKESYLQSKIIDKQLKKEKKCKTNFTKFLLLSSKSSSESKFLTKLKRLQVDYYLQKNDSDYYKKNLAIDTLSDLLLIANKIKKLNLKIDNSTSMQDIDYLLKLDKIEATNEDLFDVIQRLWKNSNVKNLLNQLDSTIDSTKQFVPNGLNEIIELKFNIKNLHFQVFNALNSNLKSKIMLNLFADIDAIIFLIDLASYEQVKSKIINLKYC